MEPFFFFKVVELEWHHNLKRNIFLTWCGNIAWLVQAIVLVLGSVKNEHTFSTLPLMKNKLHNSLGWHLDIIISMLVQKFFTLENFLLSWNQYNLERSKNVNCCCHLKPYLFTIFLCLSFSISNDVDTHGHYVYFFTIFINIWMWWVGLWISLGKI